MAVQVAGKLCKDVPDEACRYCPQYWTGECGAFYAIAAKEEHTPMRKDSTIYNPGKSGTAVSVYQLPLWS